VRYQLKTPYNNGTTHVVFEPLDFLARLAAPVPRPQVNLTRYHGVFAPNSAHLALVARAGSGNGREAHDLLSPFYYWFTEGFDTKDLKEGKALLDKLES
jgi:predicted ATPase